MSEWTVVTVIIALVGLIAGVVTPLLKLNTTITRLTVVVDGLAKDFGALTSKNSEAHGRIWEELSGHEETLNSHETRLAIIEHK